MMLIDEFMADYDYRDRREIEIKASVEDVFKTLYETDLGDSWIIRVLFFLRGLPSGGFTLNDMSRLKFNKLGETENREVLFGVAGQFWTIAGNLKKLEADEFREFNEKGFAKVTWNFSVEEKGDTTLLKTETRIKCLDQESRRNFTFYWTFVKPFSGWTREEMLAIVKRKAEEKV